MSIALWALCVVAQPEESAEGLFRRFEKKVAATRQVGFTALGWDGRKPYVCAYRAGRGLSLGFRLAEVGRLGGMIFEKVSGTGADPDYHASPFTRSGFLARRHVTELIPVPDIREIRFAEEPAGDVAVLTYALDFAGGGSARIRLRLDRRKLLPLTRAVEVAGRTVSETYAEISFAGIELEEAVRRTLGTALAEPGRSKEDLEALRAIESTLDSSK